MQCIENASRWAIHSLNPLSVFASGRVALMGDAVSCFFFFFLFFFPRIFELKHNIVLSGSRYDSSSRLWGRTSHRGNFIYTMLIVSLIHPPQDACVLSALLASPKCTIETVPRIMQIYDQIRRPFANRVLAHSRSVGLLFELNGPGHDGVKPHSAVPREVLEKMGESCVSQWEWAWSTSLDADLEKAVAML